MPPIRVDQRVKAPDAGWDALKKPWFWQTQAKQEYRGKKESAKNVVADAYKKMKHDKEQPSYVEKSTFGKKEWKKLQKEEQEKLRRRIMGNNPTGWI